MEPDVHVLQEPIQRNTFIGAFERGCVRNGTVELSKEFLVGSAQYDPSDGEILWVSDNQVVNLARPASDIGTLVIERNFFSYGQ